MAHGFKLFSIVSLVLLLLFANEMGTFIRVAEGGRTCESKSQKFKGVCVSDHNCGSVCHTEGFHGGHCRGFRHRCFCTKPC